MTTIVAVSAPTRADMQTIASPTDGLTVELTEGVRSGTFVWRTGDYSAQVAADTLEGVYIEHGSVPATSGAFVRVLDGYVTPQMFGAQANYYLPNGSVNGSPTDDSAAVQAACDLFGKVFFPNWGHRTGYWCASKIVLRDGAFVWGNSTIGDTSVATMATALVSSNGDTILDLRTNDARQVTIQGLTLYCPSSRNTHGIDVTPLRTTLRDLHILTCNVGIGGVSGVYGSHSNFYNIHALGCNYGAQRIRDTRWYGGRIAASKFDGIYLPAGASDNKFDLKLDFNERWGLWASSCNDLQIFSEAIDRNYVGGIKLTDCHRVGGTVNLARNGRNDSGASGEDTHLHLSGCSGVVLSTTTSTGQDDGGTGTLTPRYSVTLDGTNSNNVISGDLSGNVVQPVRSINGGSTLGTRFLTTKGFSLNSALPENYPQAVANFGAGTSASLSFQVNTLSGQTRRLMLLKVAVRRNDSELTSPAGFVPVIVKATGEIELGAVFGSIDSGSTFISTTNSAADLYLTASFDGTTITVTGTSNYSAAPIRFFMDLV